MLAWFDNITRTTAMTSSYHSDMTACIYISPQNFLDELFDANTPHRSQKKITPRQWTLKDITTDANETETGVGMGDIADDINEVFSLQSSVFKAIGKEGCGKTSASGFTSPTLRLSGYSNERDAPVTQNLLSTLFDSFPAPKKKRHTRWRRLSARALSCE